MKTIIDSSWLGNAEIIFSFFSGKRTRARTNTSEPIATEQNIAKQNERKSKYFLFSFRWVKSQQCVRRRVVVRQLCQMWKSPCGNGSSAGALGCFLLLAGLSCSRFGWLLKTNPFTSIGHSLNTWRMFGNSVMTRATTATTTTTKTTKTYEKQPRTIFIVCPLYVYSTGGGCCRRCCWLIVYQSAHPIDLWRWCESEWKCVITFARSTHTHTRRKKIFLAEFLVCVSADKCCRHQQSSSSWLRKYIKSLFMNSRRTCNRWIHFDQHLPPTSSSLFRIYFVPSSLTTHLSKSIQFGFFLLSFFPFSSTSHSIGFAARTIAQDSMSACAGR